MRQEGGRNENKQQLDSYAGIGNAVLNVDIFSLSEWRICSVDLAVTCPTAPSFSSLEHNPALGNGDEEIPREGLQIRKGDPQSARVGGFETSF